MERGFHLRVATSDLARQKNQWNKFTHKFAAIELNDHLVSLVVHLRKEYNTFVAVRNFALKAFLDTGTEGDASEEYDLICKDQKQCEINFDYEGSSPDAARFKWVEDGRPPTGATDPDAYWIPVDQKALQFKFFDFRQDLTTDAIIRFRYWISSDKPSLVISGTNETAGNEFAQLGKTQDLVTASKVDWYSGAFRLSHVHPPFKVTDPLIDDELVVYFTAIGFGSHLVAIEFQEPEIEITPGTDESNVMHDFVLSRKTGSSDSWISSSLPKERIEGSYPGATTVTLLPDESPFTPYTLYSHWLLTSPATLPFACTLSAEGDAHDLVTVIVRVVDYTATQQKEVMKSTILLTGKDNKKVSASVSVDEDSQPMLRRIEITVAASNVKQGNVRVTIDDVVFGDRCHFEDPCVSKSTDNICIPKTGFACECHCEDVWTGDTCERENFCQTEKISEMTGFEYCKGIGRGEGKYCLSHVERSASPGIPSFDCICNPADYWDPKQRRCIKFSECSLVTNCTDNTACEEDNYHPENPCSGCRTGYAKNEEDRCVPIDPCPGSCGEKTLCAAFLEPDSVPQAVCYCPAGFVLEKTDDSFHCSGAKLREECPEIYRSSALCQHTCHVEQSTNLTAGTGIICKCFSGHNLNEDMRSCTAGESLAKIEKTCEASEILVEQAGQAVCVCLPGHYRNADQRCVRLKYCENDNNIGDVESFCGQSVKTCEQKDAIITCNCRDGTRHQNYAAGRSFGCVHMTPEESCYQFETKNKEKRINGQVCRHVIQMDERSKMERLGLIFSCLPTEEIDPEWNECRPRCHIKENILKCLRDSKVCHNDPSLERMTCVCAAGFTEKNGICHASTSVAKILQLEVKLPLDVVSKPSDAGAVVPPSGGISNEKLHEICLNDPDPTGCLTKMAEVGKFLTNDDAVKRFTQRQSLRNKIISSFKGIFSGIVEGYTSADILSDPVIDDENQIFTNVSLIFLMNKAIAGTSNAGSPDELATKLLTKCKTKTSNDGNYCVLPGGLAFDMVALEAAAKQAAKLDPCNEGVTYCSHGSACSHVTMSDDDLSFPHNCTCERGYRLEQVSFFNVTDSLKRREIRKEFCLDIDECAEGYHSCNKNSTCFNIEGSYECNCNDGMKTLSNEHPRSCVDVCHEVDCKNGGSCAKHHTEGNAFECSCADGYRGITCEFEDAKAKSLRTTLIAVAVVLSLLLFAAVIAAIVIYKR